MNRTTICAEDIGSALWGLVLLFIAAALVWLSLSRENGIAGLAAEEVLKSRSEDKHVFTTWTDPLPDDLARRLGAMNVTPEMMEQYRLIMIKARMSDEDSILMSFFVTLYWLLLVAATWLGFSLVRKGLFPSSRKLQADLQTTKAEIDLLQARLKVLEDKVSE